MVFQQPALYPHLTARENLALGLKLRKVARDEAVRRIAEVADWLGLGALLDRRPYALSGGERQRVALGRALARRPRVLLLDEPFSSLDAPLRAQLRDDLRRLQRQLRLTTMCVTHDPAEALTLGQRVAVMREGAVQQSAPPAEIYQRPANVFVAGFLGPMNFFPGRLEAYGGTLRFAIQNGPVLTVPPERAASLRPAAGAAALLGLRPEELSLQDGATPGAFSVTVDAVEVTGADTLARARFGNERLLFRVPLHVRLAPGDVARLSPDPDRLRFFDPATGAALG
jgi:ABC-type sugar transport system ATPase subunit